MAKGCEQKAGPKKLKNKFSMKRLRRGGRRKNAGEANVVASHLSSSVRIKRRERKKKPGLPEEKGQGKGCIKKHFITKESSLPIWEKTLKCKKKSTNNKIPPKKPRDFFSKPKKGPAPKSPLNTPAKKKTTGSKRAFSNLP